MFSIRQLVTSHRAASKTNTPTAALFFPSTSTEILLLSPFTVRAIMSFPSAIIEAPSVLIVRPSSLEINPLVILYLPSLRIRFLPGKSNQF
ncbi:hypothetical protein D3C85_1233410 [compost metagenome]